MMPAIEAIMTTHAATRIAFAQVVDRNNAAVRPGYVQKIQNQAPRFRQRLRSRREQLAS